MMFGLLTLALSVSVVTDLRSLRVLDVVTLPTAALALGYRFGEAGAPGLLSGVAAALICVVLSGAVAFSGGMGWGDVKLLGAIGAVLGMPLGLAALIVCSVLGVALSVFYRPGRHVPLASAYAVGALLVMVLR